MTSCQDFTRSEPAAVSVHQRCGYLSVYTLLYGRQWRRSVVKSEGLGSLRSSHQTRSRLKFVFVFGAENGLFRHFRLFSVFGRKWIFTFVLFLVFVPKNHLHWAENVIFATEL